MIIPRLVGAAACSTCRAVAPTTTSAATATTATLARSSSSSSRIGRSWMASSSSHMMHRRARSTAVVSHVRRRTLATGGEGGGSGGGGGTSIRGGPGPGPTSSSGGKAPSTSTRGPVSWTSLGLVAVASGFAVGYFKIQRERRLEEAMGKIVTTGRPAIGGPWTLIDLDGKLVSEKTYRGKYTLLYFGFARCPDICPAEMVKVGKIMETLKTKHPDLAGKIQPLFVTVDPARDSIRTLREYGKDFHPSYEFLTGTPEQVQKMAKSYRVYVSKADETDDGDYLVDHSIVLYFHDDGGDLLDVYTQSMKPSDVVERIVDGMTKASRQAAA